MEKIIIIGCGGHAKSVVDIIEREGRYEIAGFSNRVLNEKFRYRNYKIITTDDKLKSFFQKGIRYAALGIGFLGEGNLRKRIYSDLKDIGFQFPVIQDPSAIVATDAKVLEGTIIGKNVVINSEAYIGKNVILNTGAIIEHECKIGDFSHVSIGSLVCGNVVIGNNSFVGAGSTVIQGCNLGNNVIIGAGSTVLGDVSDNIKGVGIIKRG